MGKPRNTRKYRPTRKNLKYPEIPESKKDTQKYPIVFFDTPTRPGTRPATRYFVQYPTWPDPMLKNPTRWALLVRRRRPLWCQWRPLSGLGNFEKKVQNLGFFANFENFEKLRVINSKVGGKYWRWEGYIGSNSVSVNFLTVLMSG